MVELQPARNKVSMGAVVVQEINLSKPILESYFRVFEIHDTKFYSTRAHSPTPSDSAGKALKE